MFKAKITKKIAGFGMSMLGMLMGCLASPVFAACTHPGGAGNTPAAGTTVACMGATVLSQTFWTGTNNLTFNFDGTVNASALNELLRVDTYGNGNIGWTAENITVTNHADVTSSRDVGYLQGFLIGAGDQNNPTNGDFVFTNTGTVNYTNNASNAAIYLIRFWSPTGAAALNNQGTMEANANQGYPILVYQQQRGETNNAAGASIVASGLYAYPVIHDAAYAGWVAGSGYAPNYLSSAFTEDRNFVLNNAGSITASVRPSGGGITFYSSYPQSSVINNTGTINFVPDDDSDAGDVIYYDTRNPNATADVRPQLMPYIVNNDGLIEYTGSNPDGRAIYVEGRSIDGVDVPVADRHPDAFNPDVHVQQNDTITGSIILADGDDRVALNNASNTNSPTIMMAGGLDQMLVGDVASLVTDELNGGGNAVLGDEAGWDDVLDFEGFSGNAPVTRNWEYINIKTDAQVTLVDGTQAGEVRTQGSGALLLPNANTLQADLSNDGAISMEDGSAGTFSVRGDASGSGVLLLDVDVTTGAADVLHINGNTTGSNMQINPQNISVDPAANQGIEIIRVAGTTATGDFVMLGGGTSYVPTGLAVTYELELRGQSWYLIVRVPVIDAIDDGVVITLAGNPITTNVANNDTATYGGSSLGNISSHTDGANGSVACSGSGASASCTYTPDAGFVGSDSYTYTLCLAAPNQTTCDTATVSVVVGPDAVDDSVLVSFGSTGNTFDVGGNDLFVADSSFAITGGTCSNVSLSGGVVTYDASTSPCSVSYQLCAPAPQAALCDTATLTVGSTPSIDAVDDAGVTTLAGNAVTTVVASNDHSNFGGVLGSISSHTDGANGSVACSGSGASASCTYTPDAGFVGSDSYTYTLCLAAPSQTTCDTATVAVVVNKIPDTTPPVAKPNAVKTTLGVPVTIDVLVNDSDDEGLDVNSVRLFDASSNQWVTTLTLSGVGSYTVNTNGIITFTPVSTFAGVSTVRYQVADISGNTAQSELEVRVNIIRPVQIPSTNEWSLWLLMLGALCVGMSAAKRRF